jgi:DNA-binding response OmpR family regulator
MGDRMKRVLVADDDADVRELVSFKLAQSGWDVSTARDGEDALAQLVASPPDVAVLDIMMPKLSGLDLCREIRQRPGVDDIPILLLTAKAQEADVERGFALGADDYVVKPFSPRELASRLDALMVRTES